VEMEKRYDDNSACAIGSTCTVALTAPEDMDAPVYVYYELTNVYQNHRAYILSRDWSQLGGEYDKVDYCSDFRYNGDSKVYPCGAIANSFFNDILSASVTDGTTGSVTALSGDEWNNDDITWGDSPIFKNATDFDSTKATRTAVRGFTLPWANDADFRAWSRVAGLPRFRKLYRVLKNTDLKKGDIISITIQNNYDISSFSGRKYIVVATASWIGGKNDFLGFCYIIIGALCFLFAALATIKVMMAPRKLGEAKYLFLKPVAPN